MATTTTTTTTAADSQEVSKKDELKKTNATDVNITEHMMKIEDVAKMYGSDLNKGLTKEQVDAVIAKKGLNQLTPPPQTPEIVKFLRQMTGGFSLLLWLGALLCFITYAIRPDNKDNVSDVCCICWHILILNLRCTLV